MLTCRLGLGSGFVFFRSIVLAFSDQWEKTVFWDLKQFVLGQNSFLAIVQPLIAIDRDVQNSSSEDFGADFWRAQWFLALMEQLRVGVFWSWCRLVFLNRLVFWWAIDAIDGRINPIDETGWVGIKFHSHNYSRKYSCDYCFFVHGFNILFSRGIVTTLHRKVGKWEQISQIALRPIDKKESVRKVKVRYGFVFLSLRSMFFTRRLRSSWLIHSVFRYCRIRSRLSPMRIASCTV